MNRSADTYTSFLEQISRKYSVYKHQGLESIILGIDGKLLKVYQWFVIAEMSKDDEFELLTTNKKLLSIYASAIETNIISISADGSIPSTDDEAFAYGLLMSVGESFLHSIWRTASKLEQCAWAEKIGLSFAERHQCAPTQPSYNQDNKSILTSWIAEALTLLYSNEICTRLLPDAEGAIFQKIERLFEAGQMTVDSCSVPVIHGDPNLANILICKNGEPQFIDPGPALLVGAGVDKPLLRSLDVGWDVALMAKHFYEGGGYEARKAFLKGYAAQNEISQDTLCGRILYWEIYCYLLVVTVCCNKYSDFQSASNPFGAFLNARQLSLDTYIKWYFTQVLLRLDLAKAFPVLCEENSVSIF